MPSPVRRLPTQSRSRHCGGIPEAKKTRSDHVTRNVLAARNNEAYGQVTADSRSLQSFLYH